MIELVFYQRVRAHLDHVCQNGILKAPEKYIENSVAGPSRSHSGQRIRMGDLPRVVTIPPSAMVVGAGGGACSGGAARGGAATIFFILKPRPLSIPIHHGDRWTPRRAHDALDADPIPVSCLMPHGNGRVLFTPGTPRPEKLTNESDKHGWQPGPHVHNEEVAGPHRM